MAINPTGRQVTALYQFQTTFDVFPTSGNWQTLSAYDLSAGETRGFEPDPLLGRGGHNGRDPFEPAPSLPQGGGSLRVPLCLREIGWWLKAGLGAPVTVGTTDLTHTFKSGAATIPTLAQSKKIKTGDYRRTRGLCVNGLRLRAMKEGGFPKVDLDVMLRDEAKATADPTGTIVAATALLRPPAARPVVRWEGTALGVATAADINFSNNLSRFDPLGGDEYPAAFDPGDTNVQGSLTTRYQDATWFDLADAGTTGLLEIEWAHPAAPSTRKITFKYPKVKLARKAMPITGPGVIEATFDFSSEQTNSEAAFVVVLLNDVASY